MPSKQTPREGFEPTTSAAQQSPYNENSCCPFKGSLFDYARVWTKTMKDYDDDISLALLLTIIMVAIC